MIDANVMLPPWPFRRTAVQSAAELAEALLAQGIRTAWVGSADACFQRDLDGTNRRLADACRSVTDVSLVPWGTINPTCPDWREDMRRCVQQHGVRGLRFLPGCHGYRLDTPELALAFSVAHEFGLPVQIVCEFEDIRTQHPVFRIPPVDLAPLSQLVSAVPELSIILLNALRRLPLDRAGDLAAGHRLYFDTAMLEGVDRISDLVAAVGIDRVLLGSWFPLFNLESATLKLMETTLPRSAIHRICCVNASRIIETTNCLPFADGQDK